MRKISILFVSEHNIF